MSQRLSCGNFGHLVQAAFLGHGSGDLVLCEMARRIVSCMGPDDTASRFGGDEMVILHPHATDGSGVAFGKRILAALAEPIFVSGREVVVSASVGVALCKPGMKTAEQLLREADTALYATKDHGRSRGAVQRRATRRCREAHASRIESGAVLRKRNSS